MHSATEELCPGQKSETYAIDKEFFKHALMRTEHDLTSRQNLTNQNACYLK